VVVVVVVVVVEEPEGRALERGVWRASGRLASCAFHGAPRPRECMWHHDALMRSPFAVEVAGVRAERGIGGVGGPQDAGGR
jgi:hypothetical protein